MSNRLPPVRSVVVVASMLVLLALGACRRGETQDGGETAELPAATATESAAASTGQPEARTAAPADAPTLPPGFREYAATAFGEGMTCVVGAASSDGQLAQQPYVAARDNQGRLLWVQALSGNDGMYQTRATHCAFANGMLHVLMQSDTHSQQALSQTQLSVARIPTSGGEPANTDVDVPGTQGKAYSAWVEPGAGNFTVQGGQLHVRGHYRFTAEPDTQHDFQVTLGAN